MPNPQNTVQVAPQRAGERYLDTYEPTLRQFFWEQEVAGSNPVAPTKRPIFSLFEKLGNRLLNKLLYGESRRFARLR